MKTTLTCKGAKRDVNVTVETGGRSWLLRSQAAKLHAAGVTRASDPNISKLEYNADHHGMAWIEYCGV
jgi:hypothetical protein